MTTVVDPVGTPVPVYNRSGTTIVTMTAPTTPTGVIPRSSGRTVVVVTATSGDPSIFLPNDCEIGDVVEVHLLPAGNTRVFVTAQSPETVNGGSNGQVSNTSGRIFRKVTSTLWVAVGSE